MSPTNDEIVIVKANELLTELEQQIREYQYAKNILSTTSQSTEELKNEYQNSKEKLDKAVELASNSFAGIQGILNQFIELKSSLSSLESTYKEANSQIQDSQSELNVVSTKLIESSEGFTDKIVQGISESVAASMEKFESNYLTKSASDSREVRTSLEKVFGEFNKILSVLNGISSIQSNSNPANELKTISNSLVGMSDEIGKFQNLLNRLPESSSTSKTNINAWRVFIGALKFIFVPAVIVFFMLTELSSLKEAIKRITSDITLIKSSQEAVAENLKSVKLEEDMRSKYLKYSMQILNGCGIPQVAKKLEAQLSSRGYHISNTENAASFNYKESIIITDSNNFSEAVKLAVMMGMKTDNVSVDDSKKYRYDFTIIVGADYQLISVD